MLRRIENDCNYFDRLKYKMVVDAQVKIAYAYRKHLKERGLIFICQHRRVIFKPAGVQPPPPKTLKHTGKIRLVKKKSISEYSSTNDAHLHSIASSVQIMQDSHQNNQDSSSQHSNQYKYECECEYVGSE